MLVSHVSGVLVHRADPHGSQCSERGEFSESYGLFLHFSADGSDQRYHVLRFSISTFMHLTSDCVSKAQTSKDQQKH